MRVKSFAVLAFFLAVGLVLSSCSGEDEGDTGSKGDNEPPRMTRLVLSPDDPRPGDIITANASAKDEESDLYEYEFEWYADGERIEGAADRTLDTSNLPGGAKVHVNARAVETESGRASDWRTSAPVFMGEAPGLVLGGVHVEPRAPHPNSTARAVVDYGDFDPRDVDTLYYRWYKGNQVLEGYDGEEIVLRDFEEGDRVGVRVCTDGKFERATTVVSGLYPIVNAEPFFSKPPTMNQSGDMIYIEYEVEDPDGDELSINVSGNIPGLKAYGSSRVGVNAKSLKPGRYTVTISADDGDGGRISQDFNLNISSK